MDARDGTMILFNEDRVSNLLPRQYIKLAKSKNITQPRINLTFSNDR